jgi:hypothetical protein
VTAEMSKLVKVPVYFPHSEGRTIPIGKAHCKNAVEDSELGISPTGAGIDKLYVGYRCKHLPGAMMASPCAMNLAECDIRLGAARAKALGALRLPLVKEIGPRPLWST